MSEFTFLTKEQISGNNNLDIIKKYGAASAITDFAILLGGRVSKEDYIKNGSAPQDRAGYWWTKSPYDLYDAITVDSEGYLRVGNRVNLRALCGRPVLPYSSIKATSSNARIVNGIMEVEYGEYPQMIVDESYSQELDMAYKNNGLRITGKNYTTDSIYYKDTKTIFKARTHVEYEYEGKKYIKFIGDSNCDWKILSDGRKIHKGDMYWISVEPVIWLVDEKSDTALAKKLLFAGVPFQIGRNYLGDFESADIKKFMDEHFSKDIIPSKIKLQTINLRQTDSLLEKGKVESGELSLTNQSQSEQQESKLQQQSNSMCESSQEQDKQLQNQNNDGQSKNLQNEKNEEIKRLTKLGEKEVFKQNKIERRKQLEKLRKALVSQSHGYGDTTNSERRINRRF